MNGKTSDSNIQLNSSNDLHLNDHQILAEIRRPNYGRTESVSDSTYEGEHENEAKTSIINCKSLEYDEDEITGDPNTMEFINQKLSSLNRSDSSKLSRSDSSKSITGPNEFSKNEVSVIQAQVHCQKSSDSDA